VVERWVGNVLPGVSSWVSPCHCRDGTFKWGPGRPTPFLQPSLVKGRQ
jgi:hypothetical protein